MQRGTRGEGWRLQWQWRWGGRGNGECNAFDIFGLPAWRWNAEWPAQRGQFRSPSSSPWSFPWSSEQASCQRERKRQGRKGSTTTKSESNGQVSCKKPRDQEEFGDSALESFTSCTRRSEFIQWSAAAELHGLAVNRQRLSTRGR